MTNPADREADTPEKVARRHVTTLHLIGEQLSEIESWMWQHLADVREAAKTGRASVVEGPQTVTHNANEPAAPVSSPPADHTPLRETIAAAIRAAACPGGCGKTEEECRQERIQPFVWHHGRLAVVEGTPEQFADAVLAVLPSADRAAILREAANALAALGPADSLVSGPEAWNEAIETLRRMADEQPAEAPSCPGYETAPNRCACPCEGCKHHCAAHQPAAVAGQDGAQE